jgi:hypothetical protein
LQSAAIIAKFHFVLTKIQHRAIGGRDSNRVHEIAEEPATKVRVASNAAADRPRGSGPLFESGEAVIDRPAYETIHGRTGFSTNEPF